VQEYKVYVTMIQMFDLDFVNILWQAFGDNPWQVEPTNQNYKTRLLHQVKYLLGTNKTNHYSLEEASCKKWLKIESEWNDEYEMPILKYDAN
jgi:hypothetical protein